MPFVYNTAPTANVTTNGTANTDTDHLRVLTAATRMAYIRYLSLKGKATAATALSGIEAWLKRFATASTVGSAITPQPADATSPAAKLTAFTAPTIGTTPTVAGSVSTGVSGMGAWQSQDRDDEIALDANGGANGNLDLISQSGTINVPFNYNLRHLE